VNEPKTVLWQGMSGTTYRYWVFPLATNFAPGPSNYIFTHQDESGQWIPIHIGHHEDLARRAEIRDQEDCARRNQADHIHVHRNEGGITERSREVADLLARHHPPCNREDQDI
jgi:hypothetical protein